MSGLPNLCVDFDGVLNPYSRGWAGGEIYDQQPIVGARGALEVLSASFNIVILTARDDLSVVEQALENWGLMEFVSDVTNTKVPAVAYIDDRAILFMNWDQVLSDLDVTPSVVG